MEQIRDFFKRLFQRRRRRAPRRPHVCVVGAGVSGLRCADILLSGGFEVTVLEARNRIGGRVRQAALHEAMLRADSQRCRNPVILASL